MLFKTKFNVRVINLGIPGFNTLQHLAILQYKAIPLNPDIVILGYFLNDIERRRTQKLPNIFQLFLRYFYFGTFLNGRITTFLESRHIQTIKALPTLEESDSGKNFYVGGYTKEIIDGYCTEAWEDNKEIILSMKKKCTQGGIKNFAVIIFPFEDQVKGFRSTIPQKKIVEFLSNNKIPFLDITEVYEFYLSKVNEREKLYLKNDNVHPSVIGHQVIGEAISKWLISEYKEYFNQQRNEHIKLPKIE